MKEHQGSGPLDMVTHTFSRIMMWAPFFIVLIILYEVVMRYFFAAATLWVKLEVLIHRKKPLKKIKKENGAK